MVETSYDCINILDNTVVDCLKVVILVRRLGILLVLEISEGTRKVGLLLSHKAVVKQVDSLNLGNRVDQRMVQQRHNSVLCHCVSTKRAIVKLGRYVVGRCQRTIHKVLVRNSEVLSVCIGTKRVLTLIGVSCGHTVLLTATHIELTTKTLTEITQPIHRVDGKLDTCLGGNIVAERNCIDITDIFGSFGCCRTNTKLGTRIIVVETRLQRKRGKHKGAGKHYIFFHNLPLFILFILFYLIIKD